jgi:hypothetical protein
MDSRDRKIQLYLSRPAMYFQCQRDGAQALKRLSHPTRRNERQCSPKPTACQTQLTGGKP